MEKAIEIIKDKRSELTEKAKAEPNFSRCLDIHNQIVLLNELLTEIENAKQ